MYFSPRKKYALVISIINGARAVYNNNYDYSIQTVIQYKQL